MEQEVSGEIAVCVLKDAIAANGYSPAVLETVHEDIAKVRDRTPQIVRLHAEVAYLIAQHLRETDQSKAREFAIESLRLYECLDIQTVAEAVTILGEEKLPPYMHKEVVRNRLADLLSGVA